MSPTRAAGRSRAVRSNPRRRVAREWVPSWARLSDEELLRKRFCDLKLSIRRSPLAAHVRQLYSDLERRGLRVRPHVWLSEEWFSPDGVPGIAVSTLGPGATNLVTGVANAFLDVWFGELRRPVSVTQYSPHDSIKQFIPLVPN